MREGRVAAAEKLGIPAGTVSYWIFLARRGDISVPDGVPSTATAEIDGHPVTEASGVVAGNGEASAAPPAGEQASVGKIRTPWQRAEIQEYAVTHGPTAASRTWPSHGT
jgi:hypothetical protein